MPTTHTRPDEREDDDYHGSVDDRFRAVLEGLRTTLPGAQTLMAFLLILPFQGSFGDITQTSRLAYFAAFSFAALATVLLVAPAAHQRMRAPWSGIQRTSEEHLRITVWITIVGTVAFAVALVAAVFLVTSVVFDSRWVAVGSGAVTAATLVTWFWMPLVTFNRVD